MKEVGVKRVSAKKLLALLAILLALVGVAASSCDDSDADVASENLSKEADQFKVARRIIFFNSITDKYLMVIEGRCSIHDEGNQLEVTCKTAGNEFKKHFLGLSPNVTYFVEQVEGATVSTDHYKVIFKPETIIPDVDRP